MSELVRQPVHRALTRPQMFAGVTMNFFIINLMVTTIAFLILKSWWILPVWSSTGLRQMPKGRCNSAVRPASPDRACSACV